VRLRGGVAGAAVAANATVLIDGDGCRARGAGAYAGVVGSNEVC